jgi:ABC-2 type transport system ATP-binding protein
MALLRVDHLSKTFGRVTALDDVSFSVRRGEILGLIGPNGSGKTTLFECLGGVLPADRGAIFTDDRPLHPRERATLMFYVPDGIAPWPAQTVRWALDFCVGFFGGSPAARADAVARNGLEPFLETPIGALSKGQRKRTLLALGLIVPHPLLMVDEPFDGLDLRQSRALAQVLRDAASAGRTLFLSIHQLTDAARVCDRFVLLSGGRVRGEGTHDELASLAAARGSSASDLEEVFLALT